MRAPAPEIKSSNPLSSTPPPNTLFNPRRHQNIPSNYKIQVTLPQQAAGLAAIPHERLKLAFGFRSTPVHLACWGQGHTTPCRVGDSSTHRSGARSERYSFECRRADYSCGDGGDQRWQGRETETGKEGEEGKKEEKRRRRDNGPDASGLSGPTEISGDTRTTSQ